LVINAGLLTLALVLFAGATVEEKRNRARSADVQQRLDEARQAKQLPVPP
jgi:type VI protein secretion system component VasK